MTVNFVSMAHSSDDDGDYSLPSEDEVANYVDYVKISMPGRQSFSIPCTVPEGGDAQGHGHSTNRKQSRTRRASAEQQKAASGSYSHAGGNGDHEAYMMKIMLVFLICVFLNAICGVIYRTNVCGVYFFTCSLSLYL